MKYVIQATWPFCETKVALIKVVRAFTGLGLKQAKDLVDATWQMSQITTIAGEVQEESHGFASDSAVAAIVQGFQQAGAQVVSHYPAPKHLHVSGVGSSRLAVIEKIENVISYAAQVQDWDAVEVLSVTRRGLMPPKKETPDGSSG